MILASEVIGPKKKHTRTIDQGWSTVQQRKAIGINDAGGQVGNIAVMLGKAVEIIEGSITGIIVAENAAATPSRQALCLKWLPL